MFGKGGAAFTPNKNYVHLDVFTASNTSSDLTLQSPMMVIMVVIWKLIRNHRVKVADFTQALIRVDMRYSSRKSDGGVIGPFSGTAYRIFVDLVGKSSLTATLSYIPSDCGIFGSQ